MFLKKISLEIRKEKNFNQHITCRRRQSYLPHQVALQAASWTCRRDPLCPSVPWPDNRRSSRLRTRPLKNKDFYLSFDCNNKNVICEYSSGKIVRKPDLSTILSALCFLPSNFADWKINLRKNNNESLTISQRCCTVKILY